MLKKRIIYSLSNGGLALLIYGGLHQDLSWAGNLAFFYVWLMFFCETIAVLHTETRETLYQSGRAFPAWMSRIINITYLILFIAAGWWFTGLAWGISSLFEEAIFTMPIKKEN